MKKTPPPSVNSIKLNKNKVTAFTLAEVLITIGIIGIIADMTIPTLVKDFQEKVTITQVKKVYSELLQATELIKADDGEINGWIPDSGEEGNIELTNIYAKKMNVIKNCTTAGVSGCTAKQYKYLNEANDYTNINDSTKFTFILGNGSSLIFSAFGKGGNNHYGKPGTQAEITYGAIYVDLNGPKKPNLIGQDVFSFFLTTNSLIPYGHNDIKDGSAFDVTTCKKCSSGHGCAAWIINNGNMDYLQCKTNTEGVCSTIHW